MRWLIILLTSIVMLAPERDEIKGVWLTEDKNYKVKISDDSGTLDGKIIWIREGSAEIDVNNPQEEKRNTPLKNIQLIQNLKYVEGEHKWEAEIYSPKYGQTFDCEVWLEEENKLVVKAFIGFSFINSTEILTRIK